jgi:eukaryotic-like serine/threonine-protein kinase
MNEPKHAPSPEFSISHYITVSADLFAGVGGRRSAILRAFQTRRNSTSMIVLAFEPGGSILATADDTGVITMRDPASLDVRRTIRGANDKLLNMAFAPDGRSLATCGKSGVIRLCDTLTGQEVLILKGHKAQVNGIAFAPDGSSIASCSHDGEVKLWRARSTPPR